MRNVSITAIYIPSDGTVLSRENRNRGKDQPAEQSAGHTPENRSDMRVKLLFEGDRQEKTEKKMLR